MPEVSDAGVRHAGEVADATQSVDPPLEKVTVPVAAGDRPPTERVAVVPTWTEEGTAAAVRVTGTRVTVSPEPRVPVAASYGADPEYDAAMVWVPAEE